MSPLPALLKRLFRPDDTVSECRHCGTTVEPTTKHCPSCGADEFCHFQLE